MKKNENQNDTPEAEGVNMDVDAATEATVSDAVPEQENDAAGNTEVLSGQLLRLQADFDNFRKRVQKERADWFARANEDIIEELLPVLDHFEMGLNTAKEHNTAPAVFEGFKLVYDQLVAALKKFNLAAVDAEGCEFNPHQHEAVTYMPSADVPAEHVVSQVRKGYMLGDKLVRPAQVVISSGSPEA